MEEGFLDIYMVVIAVQKKGKEDSTSKLQGHSGFRQSLKL